MDITHFRKFDFSEEQIEKLWRNALKDLNIAKRDSIAEVKFSFSYSALLKSGITCLAKIDGVRIRSTQGHHIKLLEKFSELLNEPQIMSVGNAMRAKRNTDLYGEGICITEKEAEEFLDFVKTIFNKASKKLFGHGL